MGVKGSGESKSNFPIKKTKVMNTNGIIKQNVDRNEQTNSTIIVNDSWGEKGGRWHCTYHILLAWPLCMTKVTDEAFAASMQMQ